MISELNEQNYREGFTFKALTFVTYNYRKHKLYVLNMRVWSRIRDRVV